MFRGGQAESAVVDRPCFGPTHPGSFGLMESPKEPPSTHPPPPHPRRNVIEGSASGGVSPGAINPTAPGEPEPTPYYPSHSTFEGIERATWPGNRSCSSGSYSSRGDAQGHRSDSAALRAPASPRTGGRIAAPKMVSTPTGAPRGMPCEPAFYRKPANKSGENNTWTYPTRK